MSFTLKWDRENGITCRITRFESNRKYFEDNEARNKQEKG